MTTTPIRLFLRSVVLQAKKLTQRRRVDRAKRNSPSPSAWEGIRIVREREPL